jgi:Sensors of blue-light using FAD
MALSRLVYFSVNKLVQGSNIAGDLKRILATAIANNTGVGVTGGLVFNRKYFMQVLEGESGDVNKLFAAISKDPRHAKVVVVEIKPVPQRLFGRWSMGFAAATELTRELCAQFDIESDFNPASLTGDQIAGLILDLVSKQEGMASSGTIAAA